MRYLPRKVAALLRPRTTTMTRKRKVASPPATNSEGIYLARASDLTLLKATVTITVMKETTRETTQARSKSTLMM